MTNAGLERVILDKGLREEREYWCERLSREIGASSLRLDFPRTSAAEQETEILEMNLTGALYDRLMKLTGQKSFLLYATLMAGLKVCIHKYTGSDTIAVGSPARKLEGETHQPNNLLIILDDIDGRTNFRELLFKVRQTLLDAYARQRYPFARLMKELGFDGENALHPARIVMLLEDIHSDLPALNNDITTRFAKEQNKITGRIIFRPALFRRDTIERFARHYENVLRGALEKSDTAIADLVMLTEAERFQSTVEWNDSEVEYSEGALAHQMVEAQVKRAPDAIAVLFEGAHLTYLELNERANRLAHYLRALNVGPETRVGIYMGRSAEIAVAILGALKAGGAFIPLDPAYPSDRLAFMLEDSNVSLVLTRESLFEKLPEHQGKSICLDFEREAIAANSSENPNVKMSAGNLAYIIYTSGSTGRPKGVLVEHKGLSNLSEAQIVTFDMSADSRVLQFASLSFDASVSEMFTTWISGATLCLATRERMMPGAGLIELLREEAVTVITIPPSALSVLPERQLRSVSTLITAGEACAASLVGKWSFGRRFVNAYGPTEATVCASMMVCRDDGRNPPIGRAMNNTQIYLLNRDAQPVAIGVAGELRIAGIGLARGYVNLPEVTAERFSPNPFSEEAGGRMYVTGDLASYTTDGYIEFLGRVDNQVKIRGFRIELEEIAAALNKHPVVQEAVAVTNKNGHGDPQIIAYWVANQAAPVSNVELRQFLKKQLPDYMIPSAFVLLESLPLSPNGKLDRRALPAPSKIRLDLADQSAAARTPVEEMLINIWSEVLAADRVDINDSFLDLGGHSLLATQVITRVREVFQVEVSVLNFFETPTLASLAAKIEMAIRGKRSAAKRSIARVPRDQDLPLSFGQQRLWFLQQLEPDSRAYNIPSAVRLSGKFNVAALEQTISEIIRRHEVLRTVFKTKEGNPEQIIKQAQEMKLPVVELGEVEQAEAEARRLAQEEASEGFDLERGPMLRVRVVKITEQEHIVLMTMHHIASDGRSMEVLVREMTTVYEAYSEGRPTPLEEVEIQYADYAAWQRKWLEGEMLESQMAYWKRTLEGAVPLNLTAKGPRPTTLTEHGATRHLNLSKSLAEGLKALSREESATMFMTLLAAFKVLLGWYSRQHDIVVGANIANRNLRETESLVGFFVNLLTLRTDLSGNPEFREILRKVRRVTLGAYVHQDLPFDKIIEELNPNRALGHTPLVQAVFQFGSVTPLTVELPDLTLTHIKSASETSRFDWVLDITHLPQGLIGSIHYNADLFDASTMARVGECFEALLAAIVEQPAARFDSLVEVMAEVERKQRADLEQEFRTLSLKKLTKSRRRAIDTSVELGG